MSSALQYVTLVVQGGVPIRLADQMGAPYPTTGQGALVFSNGAVLENVVIQGQTYPSVNGLGMGSVAAPSLYFSTPDRGLYSGGSGDVSIAALGARIASFAATGITFDKAIIGAVTLSGALTGTTATFSGEITAATPATADNDTTVATTAYVKAQGYLTTTTAGTTYLPLAGGTLTGALTGTTATFSGAVSTGALSATTGAFSGAVSTGALTATTGTFSGTVVAPGAQIQMVSTQTGAMASGSTLVPIDDTIPQITEGNEFMTLAITPKSATSKLIIEVTANLSSTASGLTVMMAALFQDSGANAIAVAPTSISGAGALVAISFKHTMTSGTTSATTFRVRAGGSAAGTTTLNGASGGRLYGGAYASSIVIREMA